MSHVCAFEGRGAYYQQQKLPQIWAASAENKGWGLLQKTRVIHCIDSKGGSIGPRAGEAGGRQEWGQLQGPEQLRVHGSARATHVLATELPHLCVFPGKRPPSWPLDSPLSPMGRWWSHRTQTIRGPPLAGAILREGVTVRRCRPCKDTCSCLFTTACPSPWLCTLLSCSEMYREQEEQGKGSNRTGMSS